MSQNINLEEEKKDKEDNNIVSNNELNEEPIIKDVGKVELEEGELEEEDSKEEAMIVKKPDEILLKLGDIILISDPTNEILNDQIFLIEYIDPSKIKLINSETFEKTVLQISKEGVIGDGNIKAIKVISSNPEDGYARQNDLLPGTWINIYFGGEIPTVITCEITNIEEDMIELRTTDGDTLFINFNYQGIPENIPIETFEIRPAIKEQKVTSPDELLELGLDEGGLDEGGLDEGELDEGELDERNLEEGEIISKKTVKDKVQKMLFDMNDIEFGDVINIEEYVTIDKNKYRYSIETQSNDMLEEMISNIPSTKRTNNVLNSIHIMITRFIQLRKISSTFDLNSNVTGVIKITAEDRPLAEYLSNFNNTV